MEEKGVNVRNQLGTLLWQTISLGMGFKCVEKGIFSHEFGRRSVVASNSRKGEQ